MRPRPVIRLAAACLLAGLLGACGHSIGDSCVTSTDCSPDGDRICDFSSRDGYCTIQGCDFGTCPSEAVCVRFFPGLQGSAPTCSKQADCAADEVCTVGGRCAPRSIEVRFCMATCGGQGDCRDGYECRDTTRQAAHGGEPVPDPNSDNPVPPTTAFCAAGKPCSVDTDCDLGDTCSFSTRTCTPS